MRFPEAANYTVPDRIIDHFKMNWEYVSCFHHANFEDNDFTYYPNMDACGHTNARAEYDRSTVEAYCRNAFSSAYEKAEKDNH